MKRIFILLSLLILFHAGIGEGREILVIQSVSIPPYEEALKGFQSAGHARFKRIVISESGEMNFEHKIHLINPPLILAIGMDALSKVKGIKDIPVVYLMVLNPQDVLSGEDNIIGIGRIVPPEKQMDLFLKAMPAIKNVGMVYNPDNTGHFIKKALEAAEKLGLELITKEAHSTGEVPSLIKDMAGRVDAFWMLPDKTVIKSEAVESLLLTSLEHRVPILTFSDKYLEIGALLSIDIDPFDMGNQAGQIVTRILSGEKPGNVKQVDPRKAAISINLKIAKKHGITLGGDIIADARIIE